MLDQFAFSIAIAKRGVELLRFERALLFYVGHAVSQTISGLAPHTTYHFRIVATNAHGTTDGVDMTFTTAAKRLKLAVSPRETRAGQLTCFSFRTRSSGHAVSGATIHFRGHSARTSSTGKAMICVTLSRGSYRATATKHGFTSARTAVTVRAAPTPPKPKFAG